MVHCAAQRYTRGRNFWPKTKVFIIPPSVSAAECKGLNMAECQISDVKLENVYIWSKRNAHYFHFIKKLWNLTFCHIQPLYSAAETKGRKLKTFVFGQKFRPLVYHWWGSMISHLTNLKIYIFQDKNCGTVRDLPNSTEPKYLLLIQSKFTKKMTEWCSPFQTMTIFNPWEPIFMS